MKSHKVSELELATMAFHLGEARVDRFRRFLARERSSNGELVFHECPNLDEEGCSVHLHRPLSCRLYGHFRAESAELLDECVFRGHETVLPDLQEHRLSPGQSQLAELSIDYLSYFPVAPGPGNFRLYKHAETDLEKASYLQVTGEYESALPLLLHLRQAEASTNVLRMLADCYEALKDHDAALEVLQDAIARSPLNPELLVRKGANCLFAGRLPAARQALEEALSIAPESGKTLGLLGFVHQLSGDLLEAKQCLSLSVDKELEPGPYRFQLALVLKGLGEHVPAVAMFHRALEYAPTRLQAEQALEESTKS